MATSEIIGYSIRLERRLKNRIRQDAAMHDRSLNRHIVSILEDYIEGRLLPVERALKTPALRSLIKGAIKETAKEAVK